MSTVAYVSTDQGVPVFGAKGCSVHVQEGLRAFQALGSSPILFTTRLGGPPPADLARVPVVSLPRRAEQATAAREKTALAANDALPAVLSQHGPFNVLYERYALWSYGALEWAQAQGIPAVLEVNAPLLEEQAQHRELVDVEGARAASRRAFASADVLVAVSQQVADWLGGFEEAQGRIHVLPNGVDPRRFRPDRMPAWTSPEGAFVVGFVGTLKPWHGLPVLAEAFVRLNAQCPDALLLIVGDGPERAALEEQLCACGEAVHFAGAVSPDHVPHWLTSMHVAVAPYAEAEECYFSPLKLFEYMAAGLPVVASRAGQLANVIRDGATGLLVPPSDAGALADALAALHRDPVLRARLGTTARATVLGQHTWTHVFEQVLTITGAASSGFSMAVQVSR